MAYGDKRGYKKIDIYIDGVYEVTTTWAKNCKEAVVKYCDKHATPAGNNEVTAKYQ